MKNTIKGLAKAFALFGTLYAGTASVLFNVAFKAKSRSFNTLFTRKRFFFRRRPQDISIYDDKMLEGRRWMLSHPGKEVSILSDDNLKLNAHFIETPKAKRTIIMVHGWHGGWDKDFAPCAKWYYEHGANLLIIDQRAQGDSEGKYMTLGIKESEDILSWLGWLEDNEHIDMPVYLYGISMGATSVLMAAGNQLPFYVKGIIADCGFTSPYTMLGHFSDNVLFIPEFVLAPALRLIAHYKLGLDIKENSTIEAMKKCEIPVLFIHGTADDFVPTKMTMESYNACNAPKRLVLIKGGPHALSFLADKKAYTSAVTSFFKKYN